MTETTRRVRILEIDDYPRHIPEEVKTLLAPMLDEQQVITASSVVELKAGESYDADYPADHSSYFVLLRFPDGTDPAAVQATVDAVTAFCRKRALPIIEIAEDHPEYRQYLAEAAFV